MASTIITTSSSDPVRAPARGLSTGRQIRRFLFINPHFERFTGTQYFHEPSHLYPMLNILIRAGLEAELLDASGLGLERVPALELAITQKQPQAIGISSYSNEDSLKRLKELVPFLNRSGLISIVGGPVARNARKFLAEKIKPTFIVVGDGEAAIELLIKYDFDAEKILKLQQPDFTITKAEDSVIIINHKQTDLDKIDTTRPKTSIDYAARWFAMMRGCASTCTFCDAGLEQQPARYRQGDLVTAEAEQIHGAFPTATLHGLGGDLVASPSRGTGIAKALAILDLNDAAISLTASPYRLRLAYKRAPRVWDDLTSRNTVEFYLGFEDFMPDILVELGKYKTRAAATKHLQNIAFVLDAMPNARFTGSFMIWNPHTSSVSLALNSLVTHWLLNSFPNLLLTPYSLSNVYDLYYREGRAETNLGRAWLNTIKDARLVTAQANFEACFPNLLGRMPGQNSRQKTLATLGILDSILKNLYSDRESSRLAFQVKQLAQEMGLEFGM